MPSALSRWRACDPSPAAGRAPVHPQATAPPVAPDPAPAPVAAAATTSLTLEQQRKRQLIEQVEAAYARGEADYRKGMLGLAKTEFDRVVDLMLESGLDIQSRPAVAGRVRPHRRRG